MNNTWAISVFQLPGALYCIFDHKSLILSAFWELDRNYLKQTFSRPKSCVESNFATPHPKNCHLFDISFLLPTNGTLLTSHCHILGKFPKVWKDRQKLKYTFCRNFYSGSYEGSHGLNRLRNLTLWFFKVCKKSTSDVILPHFGKIPKCEKSPKLKCTFSRTFYSNSYEESQDLNGLRNLNIWIFKVCKKSTYSPSRYHLYQIYCQMLHCNWPTLNAYNSVSFIAVNLKFCGSVCTINFIFSKKDVCACAKYADDMDGRKLQF